MEAGNQDEERIYFFGKEYFYNIHNTRRKICMEKIL